jgi:hypothetical protein
MTTETWDTSNTGTRWNDRDQHHLLRLYHSGETIDTIARMLRRTSHAIACRLEGLGAFIPNGGSERYACKTETNTQQQENNMTQINNTKATQQVTYIFGREAANVTDQDIIQYIKSLETKISDLKAIKVTSVKITAMIAEHKKDIADLVALLDAR